MYDLHDKTFKRWREAIVENIVTNIWPRMDTEGELRLRRAGLYNLLTLRHCFEWKLYL